MHADHKHMGAAAVQAHPQEWHGSEQQATKLHRGDSRGGADELPHDGFVVIDAASTLRNKCAAQCTVCKAQAITGAPQLVVVLVCMTISHSNMQI